MTIISDWLFDRAAKKMASKLPHHLLESYGGGGYYTLPQIKTAYKDMGLDPKYIEIALAEFLEFENYFEVTKKDRETYDRTRAIYKQFTPLHMDSADSSAPVNAYIKQMTGLD